LVIESTFSVPFALTGAPRIGTFVGRSKEIQTLKSFFLPVKDRKRQKILVLHGLGGIGKTQLALEFAKLFRDEFTAVFWINGKTDKTLKMGLAGIMDRIPGNSAMIEKAAIGDDETVERAIKAACAWLDLSKNFRWLMILDNLDISICYGADSTAAPDSYYTMPIYEIERYLELITHGSIIISTRLSYLAQLGTGLHIDKLSLDEGVEILHSVSAQVDKTGELPDRHH
jgi:Cdc6-like AAA superfamily ATPase